MAAAAGHGAAGKSRPGSAKAGNVDIIFRRPGSAAGKNPEPKKAGMPARGGSKQSAGVKGAFSGGEAGADDALMRALKMAGIERSIFDPDVRPATAQKTRDALHNNDTEEGFAELEEAYQAELSVAWDSAMVDHRPATATAKELAIVQGSDYEPDQAFGEVNIWRREDDEPSEECEEMWGAECHEEQTSLPEFSTGQVNMKLARRSASRDGPPGLGTPAPGKRL